MFNKQKVILSIGIFLIVLMGLFPPWIGKVTIDQYQWEGGIGYAFIFDPPKGVPTSEFPLNWQSRGANKFQRSVYIDFSRLLVQWLTLSFLVGGLILLFKK